MTGEDRPDGASAAPALRASDAERERTATLLREHCGAGRLTPEELDERLDAAYAARTVGELDGLLHDLPATPDPVGPAAARAGRPPDPARERARRAVLHVAGQAVLVTTICIAIWLATGADSPFWPKWVLLGTAIRTVVVAWGRLGPGAADHRRDETRHGRGGSQPRRDELRRGHDRER